MRAAGQADCFVVVNGPEDGTEFPIVRAPFHIGHDGTCTVTLRLDKGIEDLHALVSVVSDGYRIRKSRDKAIYVNGRPAGALRSRIVRDGGMVQLGQTLLILECSPDGLARRTHGIATDSDLVWAVREGSLTLLGFVTGAGHAVLRTLRRIVTSWTAMIAIAIVLYIVWPQFRWSLQYAAMWVWLQISDVLH